MSEGDVRVDVFDVWMYSMAKTEPGHGHEKLWRQLVVAQKPANHSIAARSAGDASVK
ncbi:hypothetical protein FKP32DRAFT_1670941 [Trametes sanguinea]|nr:hypothetical protein FKP32DRAFT_1670941 [Trametes sanguinea]